MTSLRARLERLYHGQTRTAMRFRFTLLAVDVATVAFFVGLSMTGYQVGWILAADIVIGLYLLADLSARAFIAGRSVRFFLRPTTIAEIVVLASLALAPFVGSLAFLRVLRSLRLLQSYQMARDLRRLYPFFRRHESVIHAVLNLVVFVFVVSSLVLVLQIRSNPQISGYSDALYFTVATLTTTGFGDIVLTGPWGRLLSVVIMLAGVALFLRLVQTIFRPAHVEYECPDCGLKEHDRDAVHCKHCGRVIHIETDGD